MTPWAALGRAQVNKPSPGSQPSRAVRAAETLDTPFPHPSPVPPRLARPSTSCSLPPSQPPYPPPGGAAVRGGGGVGV